MANVFPYEILFRGNEGEYSGSHIIDVAGGPARGIKANELVPVIATLNAAAIARVDAQAAQLVAAQAQHEAAIKALQAELDAYMARTVRAAKAVVAVVDNPDVDAEKTADACKAIALQVLMPERERQRIAALAKLAAAQTEADKFD